MPEPTPEARNPLVDIIRDFLVLHQRLRALFASAKRGEPVFDDVQQLVGDGEGSLLFRLKERCHGLFRGAEMGSGLGKPREALFDLAVGSLFHESMKLRENLYQTERYAPKVRELRAAAAGESDDLFRDFEKILALAAGRVSEALGEAEELLDHTRDQLVRLMADHRDDALIARTLYANRVAVEELFDDPLDAALAGIYGDPAEGYLAVARSFLASAYFDEAIEALAEAEKHSQGRDDIARLACYAEGMQAFQAGDYDQSLDRLEAWIDREPGRDEAAHIALVRSALPRLSHLVDPSERPAAARAADEILRRLESQSKGESASG